MARQEELSRFSNSGKTFFFNRGRASTDTDYLAINALYGKGQQQRIVLFPAHYFQFHEHLTRAVEELTGFAAPAISKAQPEAPALPERCPECEMNSGGWDITVYEPRAWHVRCGGCQTIILKTYEENE